MDGPLLVITLFLIRLVLPISILVLLGSLIEQRYRQIKS